MNFKVLDDLPVYDLYKEYETLINDNKIYWHENNDQICLNSTLDDPDNFHLGRGSLFFDWDKSYMQNDKLIVPKRDKPLQEEDFKILCSAFKGTYFEDVYNKLTEKYKLGRVRIMKSLPKTCLSWHTDTTPRIHYPIKTHDGCFMVIKDEVKHLEQNTWYWTNTVEPHTAFNASKEERLHLVVTIVQ